MHNGIGSILKKEFEARKDKNKKYSLRAFSRDLKMSPGFLSEVLQNKKKLSIDKTLEVIQSMGWSLRDSRMLLQTSQLGFVKSKKAKQFLRSEIRNSSTAYAQFDRLKLTKFSLISDWYCLAIMELSARADFSEDPNWIANQLAIRVENAKLAIEKLKSSGLIALGPDNRWQKTMNATVKDVPTSDDIRKFHRQHLQNAMIAIETQTTSERHISGVTMAIDKKKLPQAIELIAEFRSRMTALLETDKKNAVYHLAIQLFQLDESKLKA
ncbi:MAG: DUF4423 domain-containing protein [Bdellovibrionaceae bacterium]|nr:DUF4423 domain-containing protein [Pseudobdellovibrionaceae bacterium]